MQARFLIIILAGEPQVKDEAAQIVRVLVRQTVAEGFGFPDPHGLVVAGPCDLPGRHQMVAFDVKKHP